MQIPEQQRDEKQMASHTIESMAHTEADLQYSLDVTHRCHIRKLCREVTDAT